MPEIEKLNIYQKVLKIADAAGALQKTKDGFNYKYVPEEEIQAKVTACMQKYRVMLNVSLIPGTLKVEPYSYQKPKTKSVTDEKGKKSSVDYTIPVNEVIVTTEVQYTWVNVDNPADTIESRWAYIGQMEDASQAFGAGATYGNRYYLMKALQLATTEADPDNYRSKQKAAETYEEDKRKKEELEELTKAKESVKGWGTKVINSGVSKKKVYEVVAQINGGNSNFSSITSVDVCNQIIDELKKLKKEQKNKDNKGE